jgi:hypothetical protein
MKDSRFVHAVEVRAELGLGLGLGIGLGIRDWGFGLRGEGGKCGAANAEESRGLLYCSAGNGVMGRWGWDRWSWEREGGREGGIGARWSGS